MQLSIEVPLPSHPVLRDRYWLIDNVLDYLNEYNEAIKGIDSDEN